MPKHNPRPSPRASYSATIEKSRPARRPVANGTKTPDDADPILAVIGEGVVALPTLLTPDQVGKVLGVGLKTLERWRSTGEGPRYLKVSRGTIRYNIDDVDAFIAERYKNNTLQ